MVLGIFFVTGFVLGHALVMLFPLWFAMFAHVRTVAQGTQNRTPFAVGGSSRVAAVLAAVADRIGGATRWVTHG